MMRLTETDIEAVQEIPIMEQVVNIIVVPSGPVMQREEPKTVPVKTGRLSKNSSRALKEATETLQQELLSDYLFVLTSDLTCMLYKFSHDKGVSLTSTGSIADLTGSRREPPFSLFVDPKSRFIALLLYENTLKIIPLGKQDDVVVLKNSFNVRIRHPEVHKILSLQQDELGMIGDGTIAVLYQEQVDSK